MNADTAQLVAEAAVRQLLRSPRGTLAAEALLRFLGDSWSLDRLNQRAILDLLGLFFGDYSRLVFDTVEDRLPAATIAHIKAAGGCLPL